MIVWIEGVDRTGKSDLAAELASEMTLDKPTSLIHFGAPEKDTALEEYLGPLLDYDSTTNVVLDRFHLGEIVWPKYFGRESRMDLAERALIELFLEEVGAVGVLTYRERQEHEMAFRATWPPEPLEWEQVVEAEGEFEAEFDHVLCRKEVYCHDLELRRHGRKRILGAAREGENEFRNGIIHNTNGYVAAAIRKAMGCSTKSLT